MANVTQLLRRQSSRDSVVFHRQFSKDVEERLEAREFTVERVPDFDHPSYYATVGTPAHHHHADLPARWRHRSESLSKPREVWIEKQPSDACFKTNILGPVLAISM